ncbi:TonB-dependent receptor [Sphingobacterium sp. LRF_L2]|uniref:TonB-dependent receptor n=1 Tax=Sphingobacterium sp. LRF_L2 TaxID=3369421 RepID=UPI003F63325C
MQFFKSSILPTLFSITVALLLCLFCRATPVDTVKSIRIDSAVVNWALQKSGSALSIDRKTLNRIQGQTLGETMSHVSGVQNAYFGPNSGAPMIRSLSGNRVRVLSNGISVNDLSGISPNLNVNVDLDNAVEVELYKQSANVLFGGKAIGGAVNIKDNIVPSVIPDKKVSGLAKIEAGTNMGHRESAQLTGRFGTSWAWHFSGMNQRHGDLKIPGNTKAPIAYDPSIDHMTADMAQVNVDRQTIRNLTLYPYLSQFVLNNLDNPKWDLSEGDLYTFEQYSSIGGQKVLNPPNDKYIAGQDPGTPLSTTVVRSITDFHPVEHGVMPNSHSDSRAINLGTGLIKEKYRLGIGYRALEGYYGIPGFAQTTQAKHTHDAVQPPIEYQAINTRALSHAVQLESAYTPRNKIVDEVNLKYSAQYSDDRELIGIYRVNKFTSHRHAVRSELSQHFNQFWTGLSGLEFSFLKLNGDGIRRYLPNNLSRDLGVFTTHRLRWKSMEANLGYRHDWVQRRAVGDSQYKPSRGLAGGNLSARNFDLNQLSGDVQWNLLKTTFVKVALSQAERAPEVNELYAGNEHFAILVEENGDDRLNKERAHSYELSAGTDFNNFRFSVAYYHTYFQDYLYLAHTGMSRAGGFLVKEWRASDTKITGWEMDASYQYSWREKASLQLQIFADLVKNENVSDDHMRQWAEGDYMPNLPTSRYGFTTICTLNNMFFNSTFERYLKQRYLGKNINMEPAMPAYALLQAQAGYQFKLFHYGLKAMVSGNNLLNVEARPQNSFLKYLAPLPGRNIALSIQLMF